MSGVAWRLEGFYAFLISFFILSILCFATETKNSNSTLSQHSEAFLLMAFKNHSVTDDPSGFFQGWNNSKTPNPCSWKGISCYDGRVSAVNLSTANITGHLQVNVLFNLHGLRYIDLSRNNFSGSFSDIEFGKCSSLVVLNMSQNSMLGNGDSFPASLRNCKFLEKLDLSDNQLDGKIPGSVLGKLRNLRYLSLSKNRFSGSIPSELGSICGTLQELDLSGNKISGVLPLTFESCSFLQNLNLGDNFFSGSFLKILVKTLPNLISLRIPFNNIFGVIPTSLTNFTRLRVLDLSSNALSGNIPSGFCSSKPSSSSPLKEILFAGNFLTGIVPSELGNCRNLKVLDFSLNHLSGQIPPEIWTLPDLADLVIWGNNITGEIPKDICDYGGNLENLVLSYNLINGTIPHSLTNCKKLTMLSISHTRLTGQIPGGVGKLSNLVALQLGSNLLTGEIPAGLGDCQSLVHLDLSNNHLAGSIPAELAKQAGLTRNRPISRPLVYFKALDRSACRSGGTLLEYGGLRIDRIAMNINATCKSMKGYSVVREFLPFADNGSMVFLDLSYNSLSGMIPESLGSMSYLEVLHLRSNNISGSIPNSLGNIWSLFKLDLSRNHLDGEIPASLAKLSFLNDFDVSNNNLSGPIPQNGQLATFSAQAYSNNPGLCGYPLLHCGSRLPKGDGESDSPSNSSGFSEFEWTWVIASMGFGSGIIIGVVMGNIIFQRKQEWLIQTFLGDWLQKREQVTRQFRCN